MRDLHIIMPLAGEGSRFVSEGILIPKPLIEADGMPFFMRALSSVKGVIAPKKHSFIVRQEHIDRFCIDAVLKEKVPDAMIFAVDKTTRGAVETCLKARDRIEKEDGILILDCDLEFESAEFNRKLNEILSGETDRVNGGCLVSFKSDSTKYSYARTDEGGLVVQTAEKDPISSNALAGAYFFSKADSFLKAADKLVSDADSGKTELYVSLLFNSLIQNGETIHLARTDTYHSFGTPEELSIYLAEKINRTGE